MKPCVVLYLYVHTPGEQFSYPTSRSHGAAAVAARYMECALVQAASLRLRQIDCDVALVTNLRDLGSGGRRARRLLDAIEALGVEVVHAPYEHRPLVAKPGFMSSQYVFDAIVALAERSPPERQLWLMDADCVWLAPERVFAAAPAAPGLGCIKIPYPPDWDICGLTPQFIEELAQRMGATDARIADWPGGELLTGTAAELCALVCACKQIEREVVDLGAPLYTEEHLIALAGALGRAQLHDLAPVARRILTGPRHGAPPVADPGSLGLWHLPAEKGLGFRRGARAVLYGRGQRLARDLDVPTRALRRFNVAGGGWSRRLRDDAWIARQHLRDGLAARVSWSS
jgi:hypothetical protein